MTEFWVEAASRADLKDGVLKAVSPKGLPVILILRGEEIFALENRCAHLGCPLALGRLDGYILQCPCHDWRFDIRDGRFLDAPELAVKTYPAEIKDGKILVKVSIS